MGRYIKAKVKRKLNEGETEGDRVAILEEYVDVPIPTKMASYYATVGYTIPTGVNSRGKTVIQRGITLHVKVSDLPLGSHVKLTKVCDICEKPVENQPYYAILRNRVGGTDFCKACATESSRARLATQRARGGYNLVNVCPSAAKLWHTTLNGVLKPCDVMPGSRQSVWWICDEDGCDHEWKTAVRKVTSGSRCPVCKMSKGERRIREYIRFLGYAYTTEEPMGGLVGVGGGALRYDIAITYPNGEYALLIEFDGIGHFEPTDFAGEGEAHALEQFRTQREHDRRKDKYARLHNIPLLRIRHDEFDDIERLINEALAKVIRGDRIAC